MNVSKVTCNGITGDITVLHPWAQALNNPDIVTEKAGFIFIAGQTDSHYMLAVDPCLIHGERRYHYNLRLPDEDAITLSGNVDAQGVFMIVFKPKSPKLTDEDKQHYIMLYRNLAHLLLKAGYTQAGTLDEITQCILMEIGLETPATCLQDLAS
jgi:hypothetical protein